MSLFADDRTIEPTNSLDPLYYSNSFARGLKNGSLLYVGLEIRADGTAVTGRISVIILFALASLQV